MTDDTGYDGETVTVRITMPQELHDELKRRARIRKITVTELMRRAVALDSMLFDYERGDV